MDEMAAVTAVSYAIHRDSTVRPVTVAGSKSNDVDLDIIDGRLSLSLDYCR